MRTKVEIHSKIKKSHSARQEHESSELANKLILLRASYAAESGLWTRPIIERWLKIFKYMNRNEFFFKVIAYKLIWGRWTQFFSLEIKDAALVLQSSMEKNTDPEDFKSNFFSETRKWTTFTLEECKNGIPSYSGLQPCRKAQLNPFVVMFITFHFSTLEVDLT